jgi:hypothetical protein
MVDGSFMSSITLQNSVDALLWLWVHFALAVIFLELRKYWKKFKVSLLLDAVFGFIPFALLMVNVTAPLLLLSLSIYFKPTPIWSWYLSIYHLVPVMGDGRYLERYFEPLLSLVAL